MAPRPEVTVWSPNQSSRWGRRPVLIVLHTSEAPNIRGLRDLRELGALFSRRSAQVASHVANDSEGNDARFVADERAAWHAAGWNSISLGIEQVGYASQSRRVWLGRRAQLLNTAEWLAFWSRKYSIPLQRGQVSGGQVTRRGVVFHSQLNPRTRTDPGAGYPLDVVLEMARDAGVPQWRLDERRWRAEIEAIRQRVRLYRRRGRKGWSRAFVARVRELRKALARSRKRHPR